MAHPSPHQLAQLALGEHDQQVAEHAAACTRCTAELNRLREVQAALAVPDDEPLPAAPAPEHLWEGVARELGLGQSAEERDDAAATPADSPGAPDDPSPLTAAPAPDDASAPTPPTPLSAAPSRRNRVLAVASAAAAALVVAVAAGALILLPDTDEPEPAVAAEATLEPLADQPVPARASLVHRDDADAEPDAADELLLRLDIDELPEHDGYYELWLLDDEDEPTALLSLGPLSEETALPADLDLDAYPVVDVSREAYDGDPNHSGDSVLRGRLADAG